MDPQRRCSAFNSSSVNSYSVSGVGVPTGSLSTPEHPGKNIAAATAHSKSDWNLVMIDVRFKTNLLSKLMGLKKTYARSPGVRIWNSILQKQFD